MSFWNEKQDITMEGKWIAVILGTIVVLGTALIITLVV